MSLHYVAYHREGSSERAFGRNLCNNKQATTAIVKLTLINHPLAPVIGSWYCEMRQRREKPRMTQSDSKEAGGLKEKRTEMSHDLRVFVVKRRLFGESCESVFRSKSEDNNLFKTLSFEGRLSRRKLKREGL